MSQFPGPEPLSLRVYQGKPTVNKPQLITNSSPAVPTLGGHSLSRVTLVWFLAFSSALLCSQCQGPAQLQALPSPKGQLPRPPRKAVTSAPLSKALPEATTASTPPPQGSPLPYSGLENSPDCLVHGVAKSRTRLSDLKREEKK